MYIKWKDDKVNEDHVKCNQICFFTPKFNLTKNSLFGYSTIACGRVPRLIWIGNTDYLVSIHISRGPEL